MDAQGVLRLKERMEGAGFGGVLPPSDETVEKMLNELERLKAILPPGGDRASGGVGEGTWSVFAGQVCEERDELRARLSAIGALLSDDRYPGSKDWAASDALGRVAWLIGMYESKKREADMWVDACVRISEGKKGRGKT